jgi:hypothetical protein
LLAKGTSIVLRDSQRTRPRWSFSESLPSFILMKADQTRTLALHTTMQALASERWNRRRALK